MVAIYDDFEDGDADGWNAAAGGGFGVTATSPLAGDYSGLFDASGGFSYGPQTDDTHTTVSFLVEIRNTGPTDGAIGDRAQVAVRNGSDLFGALQFADNDEVYWDDGDSVLPAVLSSWTKGTTYDVELAFASDMSTVNITIGGTDEGTYDCDATAGAGLDRVSVANNQFSDGSYPHVVLDNISVPGLATPSNVSATAGGPESIDVSFDDASDDEDEWRVYRALSPGVDLQDYTQVATVTSTSTGTTGTAYTATDADLAQGRQYHYRVTAASSGILEGQPSGEVVATTDLPGVTGLTAWRVGETTLSLSWTAAAAAGTLAVEYKPTSDSTWQTHAAGLPLTRGVATIDGLRNGEAYDVRVVTSTADASTVDQAPTDTEAVTVGTRQISGTVQTDTTHKTYDEP